MKPDAQAKGARLTTAFGQQWGIIGAEDTTDLTQKQPTLKAQAVTPGSVTIGFNKSVSSGVRILSKRGAEAAFSFLAIASPYIYTRDNLVVGSPESRQYQAQYLNGDDPVGQPQRHPERHRAGLRAWNGLDHQSRGVWLGLTLRHPPAR